MPPKPALRLEGAVSDPCADARKNGALNLLDVVNMALCNNPQTREAWANAKVQAAQVGISKSNYLPSNNLTASGNSSRVNAAPSVYQRNLGLTLSYLLYDFGAREANLQNARLLLNAATATQDSTVQTVFFLAVQAFYQTHATLAALDAARESERAAKESFAAAEARYTTGSATPADKLQAQTAYSQATLNRITADGSMKNAKGALANILGMDANRDVPLEAVNGFAVMQNSFTNHPQPDVTTIIHSVDPTNGHGQHALPENVNDSRRDIAASNNSQTHHDRFPHSIPDGTTSHSTKLANNASQVAGYPPQAGEGNNESLRELHVKDAGLTAEEEALRIFERDVAALIEEARLRRPDLYAAEAQVKAAKANVDAARAAGKPSIYLNASTNQSSSAGVTSRGSTSGISLTAPIFSGFAPTYRIRAAEAQVEAQNAQFERLRLQVALDVWTAYQNLTTATQSLRTTADLLNSAEQSDHVALGRYKAGVGSILDVLNAQSALASARQQRIQSTFNWNVSRAALAQAMGSLDASLLQALPDSYPDPSSNTEKP